VGDALLQNLVGRKADRVEYALGFEVVVDLRRGEGRVAPEVEPNAARLVAIHDGNQDDTPFVGAVHVAGAKRAPLQVAELVEQEQRVITGAAEVTVIGRALLVAVGRAELEPMSRMILSGGRRS